MLCPSENPDDLARTISAALAVGPDRRRLSVERASGFEWKEIARQYRSFFEEVIAQRQGLPV
jgi:hypothetical protein